MSPLVDWEGLPFEFIDFPDAVAGMKVRLASSEQFLILLEPPVFDRAYRTGHSWDGARGAYKLVTDKGDFFANPDDSLKVYASETPTSETSKCSL